jgi:Putative Flp pilus-assembly TadE/G-like
MENQRNSQRGFVVIAVSLSIMLLIGVAGLAVDLGRMYIGKSEAQAFCDAASLSAAVKLDGSVSGITAAKTVVTASFQLPWNYGGDKITTPVVDFATAVAGPWVVTPAAPAGYVFVRVRTSMPVTLSLLAVVTNSRFGTVAAQAVAAQVVVTRFEQGLAPYTVVSTKPASPDFGLTRGNEYDIQWPQYNATRNGCSPITPMNCFSPSSAPCSGDNTTAHPDRLPDVAAMVQNWGSSTNGYWGSNQNSMIATEIIDAIQTQPVGIDDSLAMTSGNKNAQAGILDQRVMQDGDVLDKLQGPYFASSFHNGRRLLAVPVANPTPTGTIVIGFASFLLETNATSGRASNFYASGSGNDPYCAIYVGPYVLGGTNGGGSNSSGAYKISLVQ